MVAGSNARSNLNMFAKLSSVLLWVSFQVQHFQVYSKNNECEQSA